MQIRRRCTRWKVDNEAKIKLEGAESFVECTVTDVSFNGVQVSLAQKLPKDTFLKLTLALSDETVFELEAWVVWHRQIQGYNLYGLYFTKIKDADKEKIYQFMRRRFPQELNKQWWRDLSEEKERAEIEDRRTFARFTAKLDMRYLDIRTSREGIGSTEDISAKGIGFITSQDLPTSTPVEMWLELSDGIGPYYTRGEVVWTKRLEPDKYRVGVNMEKADLMGLSRVLRGA